MEHLVKKVQCENDAESFIQLMELNRQSMLKVARSYLSSEQDIADAMQDTILTCYEKIHTLQQPQYFKTWLIRIVIEIIDSVADYPQENFFDYEECIASNLNEDGTATAYTRVTYSDSNDE